MNDYGFTWTTSEELVPAKTLRDEFAIAALPSVFRLIKAHADTPEKVVFERAATWAYQVADAMMEAREK